MVASVNWQLTDSRIILEIVFGHVCVAIIDVRRPVLCGCHHSQTGLLDCKQRKGAEQHHKFIVLCLLSVDVIWSYSLHILISWLLHHCPVFFCHYNLYPSRTITHDNTFPPEAAFARRFYHNNKSVIKTCPNIWDMHKNRKWKKCIYIPIRM